MHDDLKTLGQNNDIQDYNTLIDAVASAVATFEDYAKEVEIDNKLIAAIKADYINIP